MVGFVIWIVGLILTIKAALEIGRLYAPWEKKLLAIVLILLTSWIGLFFYYFYARSRMTGWLSESLLIRRQAYELIFYTICCLM